MKRTKFLFVLLLLGLPHSVSAQADAPPKVKPGGQESALLTKGSLWRGTSYQVRPVKTAPQAIEVAITDRDGANFKGAMRWNGRHLRNIVGTVVDGTIQWSGAPGEAKPGHFNIGTIDGKRIELKYFKTKTDTVEDGTLILEYRTAADVTVASGSDEERLQKATAKILGAALAHALAKKAAEDPNADGGTLLAVALTVAVRDAAIGSALRDLFPHLKPRQSRDIQTLIVAAIDGRLEFGNRDQKAAKERLVEDLRRIDPDLADAAVIADFVYALHQLSRRR